MSRPAEHRDPRERAREIGRAIRRSGHVTLADVDELARLHAYICSPAEGCGVLQPETVDGRCRWCGEALRRNEP